MDNLDKKLIEKEIKGCFDYFWNESNATPTSKAYGLTLDKTGCNSASIAAVGFAMASYPIGVKRGFITFSEGYERSLKTLKTLEKIERFHGFFPHFINVSTGLNNGSEISTIDTTLCLLGCISAAEYFGEDVKEITYKLLDEVEWEFFINHKNGKPQFNMGYSLKFWPSNDGFCPANWDHYAEQLLMYVLYAGKDTTKEEDALALYNGFTRHIDSYQGYEVIHCYGNALFIHQFTHLFANLEGYVDCNGVDWVDNSIKATICNRLYCLEFKQFKTYHESSWGFTAFLGKKHYKVFGAKPFGFGNDIPHQEIDGSVAPYAALSSMTLTPELSLDALRYFNTIEGLNGKYGLGDSYNLDDYFVSNTYLGIDKGPTLLALDNYLSKTTWKYFMQSDYIKKGLNKLKYRKGE